VLIIAANVICLTGYSQLHSTLATEGNQGKIPHSEGIRLYPFLNILRVLNRYTGWA